MADRRSLLRTLPAIDRLLHTALLAELALRHPHLLIKDAAQQIIEELRRQLLDPQAPLPELAIEAVAARVAERVAILARPSLRRVLNLTGTLLHTNLGRAPLCEAALQAVDAVGRGYSNLEFDLESGRRGQRFAHIEALLCRLTGGEAACVVNNNAGAVMLCLAALAGGRSALVSRGELVEIGGSFRIPEIMAASGVRLVEVGTTNKTHPADYSRAIDADTALILKVHTSNYRILGFTEAVDGRELTELAHALDLPVLEDLGSGLLCDLTAYGLPREPTVREALATGIDLVTFSGDKLLGGPQAGIIVGRREVVERVRKHPMARALRIDKLTLAALEATLQLYLDPEQARREIPTLRMLSLPAAALHERCSSLLPAVQQAVGRQVTAEIVPATATVGGGALPLAELPGWAIALHSAQRSANTLSDALRRGEPAVIGRIQDDRLLLDPRTLLADEEHDLLQALRRAVTAEPGHG